MKETTNIHKNMYIDMLVKILFFSVNFLPHQSQLFMYQKKQIYTRQKLNF